MSFILSDDFSESLAYVRYLRDQYRFGKPSSWVIVLKTTGRVIGTIGYTEWDEDITNEEVWRPIEEFF